jgi:hypothetical protein
MSAYLIWITSIALEVVILFRGVRTELVRKYPFFHLYICCVFLIEALRFLCYRLSPHMYQVLYWNSDLVAAVMSYGILLDTFSNGLKYAPGASRFARKLLLVVFVLSASYGASDLANGGFGSWLRAAADAGRYLRYVEAILLLMMLWLLGRYRVSLGRNLLGLIAGYSLLVGLHVSNLALWFQRGHELSPGLRKLYPAVYMATLGIWCATLWSDEVEIGRPQEGAREQEYEQLAVKTRSALVALSTRVARTLRP